MACVNCGTTPIKYKCKVCREPTCSLICFKTHESSHPNEQPTPTLKTELPPEVQQTQGDPLVIFAQSKELCTLLGSHPQLRAQLKSIHSAVRDIPSEDFSVRGRGGGRGRGRRTPWQRPDDLERGVRALHSALDRDAAGSRAMQEFAELVVSQTKTLPAIIELDSSSKAMAT